MITPKRLHQAARLCIPKISCHAHDLSFLFHTINETNKESPHVRYPRRLDSGFYIVGSGLCWLDSSRTGIQYSNSSYLDSGFHLLDSGFQKLSGLRISKPWIPNFSGNNLLDCRFRITLRGASRIYCTSETLIAGKLNSIFTSALIIYSKNYLSIHTLAVFNKKNLCPWL